METSSSRLPDLQTLTAGLNSVLNGDGSGGGPVLLLDREPNDYASGWASEIVTCRLSDGTELRLFFKYGSDRIGATNGNFNTEPLSDVGYEAEVYRVVLQPLHGPTPKFYGTYKEEATGRSWLIVEYIEDAMVLHQMAAAEKMVPVWRAWRQMDDMWEQWEQWELNTMGMAASWIGRFHAVSEVRLSDITNQFLKKYDSDYYLEQARRTLLFSNNSSQDFRWLHTLCEQFQKSVAPLLRGRPTIVHGDYYSHNILVRHDRICPLDWELSGIDLGEMDLACLTEGWAPATARHCELEYQRARWPGGAPADFEQVLGAARLCLYFYNLGHQPQWASQSECVWYSEQLQAIGEQMGLMKVNE